MTVLVLWRNLHDILSVSMNCFGCLKAWANSVFALKVREFLLVWKKGNVSIIYSFSHNSPYCTLFSNGKIRCILGIALQGNGFPFYTFLCLWALELRKWSIRIQEEATAGSQSLQIPWHVLSFKHTAEKRRSDVRHTFQGLCLVSGLGVSTSEDW